MKRCIALVCLLGLLSGVVSSAAFAADRISLPGGFSCSVTSSGRTRLLETEDGQTRGIRIAAARAELNEELSELRAKLRSTPRSKRTARRRLNAKISRIVKEILAVTACSSGRLGSFVLADLLGTYNGTYTGTANVLGIVGSINGSFQLTLGLSKDGVVSVSLVPVSGDLSFLLGAPGYSISFPVSFVRLNRNTTLTPVSGSPFKVKVKSDRRLEFLFPERLLGGVGSYDVKFTYEPGETAGVLGGRITAKDSLSDTTVVDVQVTLSK